MLHKKEIEKVQFGLSESLFFFFRRNYVRVLGQKKNMLLFIYFNLIFLFLKCYVAQFKIN